LLLARRFRVIPAWRRWHPWLLASGAATAAVMAVFIPNTSSPAAGALQRVAVSIPLVAMSAVAARLIARRRAAPLGYPSDPPH
jgi:peptidoglycan/LPS O-acetylase OafA/YrhL